MARIKIGNVFPPAEYLLKHCAPAGYGLGDTSGKSVLWSEIDNAKEFGIWAIWGSDGIKTVNGISFYYANMLVLPLDTNAVTQMLFPIVENTSAVLIRRCVGGVWQEWEWPDPPMSPGVEYRTTERWDNKPVYTTLVDCDKLAVGANTVTTEHSALHILRYCGHAGGYGLPMINGTLDNEYSAWANATDSNGYLQVGIYCGSGVAGNTGRVQVWYTKP